MNQTDNHLVLIVDDEAFIGSTIERLLKMADIKSVYKSDAGTALEFLNITEHRVSLVISDQQMPGMTGIDFLARVRDIEPKTLRFLVTAHSDPDIVVDSVNKGEVDKYILKPWDDDHFLETIKSALTKYDEILERDRLFKLAKQKNLKLYRLGTDLMTTGESYEQAIKAVEETIHLFERFVGSEPPDMTAILDELAFALRDQDLSDPVVFDRIYGGCLKRLHNDCTLISRARRATEKGCL